ncbi:unnamed protein product [Closterium sp. NIES-54]
MHLHTHTRTNRRHDVVQCEFAPNTAAVDVLGSKDVGAASTSGKHCRSKGKGGSGGGGGGSSGGGGGSGGGCQTNERE